MLRKREEAAMEATIGQMQELTAAVDADDADAVRRLVTEDPRLASAKGEDGLSLVVRALYRQRRAALTALLAAGPDLDVFEAAALGRGERLAVLLAADPALARARSADGFTPLHLAAFFGAPEAAALLLRAGAEVNAVAQHVMRVTPLNSAAAVRHREVAEVLLDHGADLEACEHGFTPLHSAAHNGDLALVEMLLARGADAARRTADGRTALDLALEAGHAEVVERLRSGSP
jgi:uncharacterized protein